jgi:hypothetical protein
MGLLSVILSGVEESQFFILNVFHGFGLTVRDFSTSLEMTIHVQKAAGLNAGECAWPATFNAQRPTLNVQVAIRCISHLGFVIRFDFPSGKSTP